MSRRLSTLLVLSMLAGLLVAAVGTAVAHECWDADDPPPDYEENQDSYWHDGDRICRETWVVPNWRENYIPLFGLENRHDPEQRKEAQRWRNECSDHHADTYEQMCAWSYGGFSFFENNDDDETAPNRWHAGFAANHCFLFEAAHQCEDHHTSYGEGVHDTHGGSIYVDVCLTRDPESRYCQRGMEDTTVGINAVDHLGCAPAGCLDEYHVVKPLDTDYTQRQMENSEAEIAQNVAEPGRYVCGHHSSGRSCREQARPLTEVTYPVADAAFGWRPDRSDLPRACPNHPGGFYTDTEGNEHEGAIDCAAWWHLANGLDSGLFNPTVDVTREQVASFLYRLADRSEGRALEAWDEHNRFDDVSDDSPHVAAINRLAEAGIILGDGNGTFDPQGLVSKDQLASLVARTIGFVTNFERVGNVDRYDDVDATNPHRESVNAMWELGIMPTDDGTFGPDVVITRAAMAAYLMRAIDLHVEEGYANPPSARYGAVHSHDHGAHHSGHDMDH